MTISTNQQQIISRDQVPYDYYRLINDTLSSKNFSFTKILLDKIPSNAILPDNDNVIGNYYGNDVEWYKNQEAFNFLFQRAFKQKKKHKDLRKALSGQRNLNRICKYGNIKIFKFIAKDLPRNHWFLNNSWCLDYAITNNNYSIVKELLSFAQDPKLKSVDSSVIRSQLNTQS